MNYDSAHIYGLDYDDLNYKITKTVMNWLVSFQLLQLFQSYEPS